MILLLWKNIKEMLFKRIYKDNQEIEKLLDYAVDLYITSKKLLTC